jgi:anaerobic selenocysteine-containing dehydrogenase
MASQKELIKTTCPRDCYDRCGIVVIKRDGAITKVMGNPAHPINRGPLCGKCSIAYNGAWRDEGQRLLHPLRRAGPKGSGTFEPISWEEALREIAGKLTVLRDAHGAETIFHTHYTGTCSLIAGGFPCRFFERLGATEVDPDTVCNKAGHQAWDYVFGDSGTGFDPRTAKDSRSILVWGANPSHSAPHINQRWLLGGPAKVIVVDPVRHETAAAADLHLQLRPGSDAALAFTLLHVLRRDGLLDDGYIRRHVLGFEEVEPLIAASTLDWGAAATGLPPSRIEEAARLYGAGPSLMWLGQGLQRQPLGGNIFRACAMLPALTGNIGKPGSGFYYLNSTYAIGGRGGQARDYEAPGTASGPAPVSQMDIPALLQTPDAIRAYVVWNCNPVASNPEQALMRQGLAREDLFTVVVDCFQTDTADYADIILPAASFLEFDDLSSSYFELMIGPQVKCQEPLGESLPNQEIFRRLARAMGFEDPPLHEDDQTMIDDALRACGAGLDWETLKVKGWAYVSEAPLMLWAEGRFPTPSGKIEIASSRAEADGHPRVPQPSVDTPPAKGRLRLLSPADKWLMNSSYGNDPKILKAMGPATVVIHPDDAAAHGIGEGDPVRLANEAGALSFVAKVSDMITPGTLLTTKSRWPKRSEGAANVNLLHRARKTDMGESTAVHATEVTITPDAPS